MSKKVSDVMDPAAKMVSIPITSQAAEEILIGICHRCKQDGIRGTSLETELATTGKIISKIFEKEFNLSRGTFDHHYGKNVIVRVRTK